MEPTSKVIVELNLRSEEVELSIRDRRSESFSLFNDVAEDQRPLLARDAWTIGLRALSNAYTQAQEVRLVDVGQALVADVDSHLRAHVERQQQTITAVLSRFFDPMDGQVTQRLTAFVDDQGVLARLLDKYIGPQNSVLTETLARQVGETSALFKKLSPTDSEGLIKVLEGQLRQVLDDGHSELVRALDPLAEDGAVARFLHSLREELRTADEDRAKSLATALTALDANDETSLINRLVRETNGAREAVLQAVNPDAPNSPMAIMKQTLTCLLREHTNNQAEAARLQQERQDRFEKEVRDALARMESKRAQSQLNPRGGFDFEDAVVNFVTAAVRSGPYIVEATGNTAGVRTRCKKGDLVIRFTEESAFSGAGIVFEAKRDASYNAQKAIAELDAARANRNSCAGVFVMAKSHAAEGFPAFARYASNVLVVWDEENPATDSYLHAAIMLGLGLAARSSNGGDQGDIDSLRDIGGRIEEEVRRLERMEKRNEAIRKNSDGIGDEVRKGMHQLQILIRNAKSTLAALNIQLIEEDKEKGSPIMLPQTSLSLASAALVSCEEAVNS